MQETESMLSDIVVIYYDFKGYISDAYTSVKKVDYGQLSSKFLVKFEISQITWCPINRV